MTLTKRRIFNREFIGRTVGARNSIIESFLEFGRIPQDYVNLNSNDSNRTLNGDDGKNDMKMSRAGIKEKKYQEFDRIVVGTNITIKEKIQIIENIKEDCNVKLLDAFEKLAVANGWNDQQMGTIFRCIMKDEEYQELMIDESYSRIRGEIMKVLYPKIDARLIANKLLTIEQINFMNIKDYYNEVANAVVEYGFTMELSKRETERKLEEIFFNGLGRYTSIEIYKLGYQEKSAKDVVDYLFRFEEGILMQGKLSQLSVSKADRPKNIDEFKNRNSYDDESSKTSTWCKFHRSKFHNTRDCILNPINKQRRKVDVNDGSKNMVIMEHVDDSFNSIILDGVVNDSCKIKLLVDTGSTKSFINAKAVEEFKLRVEEAKPLKTVFGDGDTETSRFVTNVNLQLYNSSYKVQFYILDNLPETAILGNDFG